MAQPAWQPHGLVLEWGMESLYRTAQVTLDPDGNLVAPKAHLTPPESGSQKACDLVIQHLTAQGAWQVACFAKTKSADNTADTLVRALESQALGYCTDFLSANPPVDVTYACTMFGASICCWMHKRGDDSMVGYWNGQLQGSFDYYLDIGLDENRGRILAAFNSMKAIHTT
ncbi:unnamed protein product [Clonostachys byssicola]|uniref:Uncharacterized protein n=1 Tax=Clonostachys byssicola TaxID=160290 RepID=A0A9N9Y9J3_9HYPO|nr:unnamed protein product [Clonostachys byssicola]